MNIEVRSNPLLWPRRLFLTAAAAAAASCAVLGPTEDHSQLPLLRDDPLAAKDLLDLPLIKESEQGYKLNTSKPSHAEILRIFEIETTRRQEVFEATLTIARQAGWEDQFPSSQKEEKTSWSGVKHDPPRSCHFGIFPQRPRELSIRIIATQPPPGR